MSCGLAWALAVFGLAGCGGARVYVHPGADLSFIKRAAVLPFTTSCGDPLAGDKVTALVVNEFLIRKKFDVVEPGEVQRVLSDLGLGHRTAGSGVDLETLKKLGQALDIQAVILGDVREFSYSRDGSESKPVVGLSLRLLDTESGKIAWMGTYTGKGGPGFLFLGLGEISTLSELAEKVCRDTVNAVMSKAY